MIIDGRKSYSNEYEESDLFYNQDNVKIYMKIVDDFLYIYDEDNAYSMSGLSRVDLYLGSDDVNTFSNRTRDGYVFTYRDQAMICDNASNTCATSNYVSNALKGLNKGAEYKIPISSLGITSISDLRNVKFNYISSGSEVKVVSKPYKYNTSQFTGKTVVVAEKPASWSDIYTYFYLESGATYFAWPGVQMYEIEDDAGKYAFVLPGTIDPQSQYVIFNKGSGGTNNQMPGDNYIIYNFTSGQHKYWDGTIVAYTDLVTTNAFESWYNYPTVGTSDNDIRFKIKLHSDRNVSKGVCVHVYSNENSNMAGSWPGLSLTQNTSTGYWEGTLSTTGTNTDIRLIFNNCKNGFQYPSSTGLLIKAGMTLEIDEYKNSSNNYYYKYYVTNDNN